MTAPARTEVVTKPDMCAPCRRVEWIVATVGILLLAAIVGGARAMVHKINHDEYAWIGGGGVIARYGLVPYRDFPFNHAPGLPLIYAGLFKLTDHLVLAARLFSVACGIGTAIALFVWCGRAFGNISSASRLWVGIAAALMLIVNPVTTIPFCRAGNYAFPTLCVLVAWMLLPRAFAPSRSWGWALVAGLLAGLAVAVRHTFPVVIPGLLLYGLLAPGARAMRARRGVILLVGIGIGTLPLMIAFAVAPAQTYWSLVTFFHLTTDAVSNTDPHAAGGFLKSFIDSTIYKVRYVFWPRNTRGAICNAALVTLFFVALAAKLSEFKSRRRIHPLIPSLLLVLAGLYVGALIHLPLSPQYLYPPVPFLIVLVMSPFWASESQAPASARREAFVRLAAGAFVIVLGMRETASVLIDAARTRDVWVPHVADLVAKNIRQLVPSGRVLTLANIYPLEAGVDIYPELALTDFAYRIADRMTPEQRRQFKIYGPPNLEELCVKEKPAAILVVTLHGFGKELLPDLAKRYGLTQEVVLNHKLTLYVAPSVKVPASIGAPDEYEPEHVEEDSTTAPPGAAGDTTAP